MPLGCSDAHRSGSRRADGHHAAHDDNQEHSFGPELVAQTHAQLRAVLLRGVIPASISIARKVAEGKPRGIDLPDADPSFLQLTK